MRNRAKNQIKNQIELYLIRHGSTVSNEEHRYLGQTDEPLSAEGIRQLKERALDWKLPIPELVFASPMQRCLQSAALLFPSVTVMEVPEWKEMDFGRFEGKNYEQLKNNPDYQAWIDSGGTIAFPGGENRQEFVCRTICGMENVLELLSERLQQRWCPECGSLGTVRVAALVHGGTIMALLSHYAGGDFYDYQVANGRGYHCGILLQGGTVKMQIKEKL